MTRKTQNQNSTGDQDQSSGSEDSQAGSNLPAGQAGASSGTDQQDAAGGGETNPDENAGAAASTGAADSDAGATKTKKEPPVKTEADKAQENIVGSGNSAPAPKKTVSAPAPEPKKPTDVQITAEAITRMFDERGQTSLPAHSESEIRKLCENKPGVAIEFIYEDEAKTKGKVKLIEFSEELIIPENGHFTFGADYGSK